MDENVQVKYLHSLIQWISSYNSHTSLFFMVKALILFMRKYVCSHLVRSFLVPCTTFIWWVKKKMRGSLYSTFSTCSYGPFYSLLLHIYKHLFMSLNRTVPLCDLLMGKLFYLVHIFFFLTFVPPCRAKKRGCNWLSIFVLYVVIYVYLYVISSIEVNFRLGCHICICVNPC